MSHAPANRQLFAAVRLRHALQNSCQQHGGVHVLVGGPGMGKTTLLQALLQQPTPADWLWIYLDAQSFAKQPLAAISGILWRTITQQMMQPARQDVRQLFSWPHQLPPGPRQKPTATLHAGLQTFFAKLMHHRGFQRYGLLLDNYLQLVQTRPEVHQIVFASLRPANPQAPPEPWQPAAWVLAGPPSWTGNYPWASSNQQWPLALWSQAIGQQVLRAAGVPATAVTSLLEQVGPHPTLLMSALAPPNSDDSIDTVAPRLWQHYLPLIPANADILHALMHRVMQPPWHRYFQSDLERQLAVASLRSEIGWASAMGLIRRDYEQKQYVLSAPVPYLRQAYSDQMW